LLALAHFHLRSNTSFAAQSPAIVQQSALPRCRPGKATVFSPEIHEPHGIIRWKSKELSFGTSLLAYPAAYLAGILMSFTPCVYPIIPIQLGFIGGRTAVNNAEAEKKSFSTNGFSLSVLFVIGMSLVYASLGAFAALTGTLFGSWAAGRWTFIIVADVILLMALSMFDVFAFQTPQILNRWNPERKGKRVRFCVAH
jgi:thiol:disulfide interchange protein